MVLLSFSQKMEAKEVRTHKQNKVMALMGLEIVKGLEIVGFKDLSWRLISFMLNMLSVQWFLIQMRNH